LKLSPERERAEQAVDEYIFQPALAKATELAKLPPGETFPEGIKKRLRAIVNSTVRHAVRPSVFADLNDRKIRQLIINESLKHLVWSFQQIKNQYTEFITPDISDEEFEKAYAVEKARADVKEQEDKLQMEEDRRQRLYDERQTYASSNVADEIQEITPEELQRANENKPSEKKADNYADMGLDEGTINALKQREERRKMILSQLEEPDIPEWLKHAVDTEDKEYFPMASGRFRKEKSREDLLAEFFQSELDELKVGSEEETALLDFLEKFTDDEERGVFEPESVDEVKKRVNAMLKEIEDRTAHQRE
jgi:hypothetical protein